VGAALGRRFAKAGLTVALTGRNSDRVRSVAAEITNAGGRAHALPGDVSSADDVKRLTAEVQALGTLGIAIFNAGNAVRGTPLEITPEQFESTWRRVLPAHNRTRLNRAACALPGETGS
jgi:NAD(P)-dependent dehydrogenase (short-subunit alcohol dehydrogenase family)